MTGALRAQASAHPVTSPFPTVSLQTVLSLKFSS